MDWRKETGLCIALGTTGLDPTKDRLLDIGMLLMRGDATIGRSAYGINPGCTVDAEALTYTGLTQEFVDQCPPYATVEPLLHAHIGMATYLVTYNAPWSWAMLHAHEERVVTPMIDLWVWAREFHRYEKGGQKLQAVADRLGIRAPTGRRASVNAYLLSQVLMAWGGKLPADIDELLRRQKDLRADQDARFQKWLKEQPAKGA